MDQYFLGKFVVVRSYSAGVHAGIVESVEADRVRLQAGALRLWRWQAKGKTTGALHSVAKFGLGDGSKTEASAGAVQVNAVIELIEVAPAAVKTFSEVWK